MLEHVSPATRLLEKRRQMFEVQEALEQQKQEYARKVRRPWLLDADNKARACGQRVLMEVEGSECAQSPASLTKNILSRALHSCTTGLCVTPFCVSCVCKAAAGSEVP